MKESARITIRTAFLLLAGAILLGAIVLRMSFAWYLRSDRFQSAINVAVTRALKANGSFMPLHYADGTFYSDGFEAKSAGGAFFSKLRAEQIRALFNWRGLLHHRWQVDELLIQKLDVRFADRTPSAQPVTIDTSKSKPPAAPRAEGWRLDLRKGTVNESSWTWGPAGTGGGITGSSFTLTPDGDAWLISATNGKISQTGWPDLLIESARMRYNGASLFITESTLRNETGRIAVNGEVNFHDAADLQATASDIPLTPLLPNDWRARLRGKISGDTKIHAPLASGTIHIEGNLRVAEGQVEALPLLDQIATFTRTERFRRMNLSRASVSFTRDAHITTGKDVVIESEGLMRIEGAFTIVDGQIDGLFQVGVTGGSLQWLPGSQERVFTVQHDGYFWTPLRLTGPAEHPKEDLTPRLVAAAAGQLLQNSQDAVIDTARSLLDLIPR